MTDIKKPKAEVYKIRPNKSFAGQNGDIHNLKEACLSLANEIERLKDQTPWPNWSSDKAKSLRDYANQLPD